LNSEAVLLKKQGEKINVVFKNGKTRSFDKVILALPIPISKELLKAKIDKSEYNALSDLSTIGALSLILRLKKPFLENNAYWLNILDSDFPFIALVEQTNFIDKSHYNNEHLVYLGGYYPAHHPIFIKTKKEIFAQFLPYLKRINPEVENNLIGLEIFKSFFAQPIIPINYSGKKPKFKFLNGQVILASANHIFPWDRGLNYSIKLAKQAVSLV